MSRIIDLTGKRFGKLTVVKRVESATNGSSQWLCRCDCGNEIVLPYYTLKRRTRDNCGCIEKPHFNTKHGGSNTALYNMWKLMIYRCENPKNNAYKYYGARGLSVCEEWHDFLVFKKWVDDTKPDGEYTLDRIDNNKGYSPSNCRWASKSTQANNRRSNVQIDYNGETHNLMEWSSILGFDYKRVHNRMYKLGWTFEQAIQTPICEKKRNKVERKTNGRIFDAR